MEKPGDGGSLYDPPHSTHPPEVLPPPHTTILTTADILQCHRIVVNYELVPSIICAMSCIFGILYLTFGYRFFKATMFMTGFIFASMLTYLICLEENLLPTEGKIGVALAAGILFGITTMLVQYIGLFMTGLHHGILLGVGIIVIIQQFYEPTTKWLPIGILFCGSILFAIFILYCQRLLSIASTAMIGAFMILVCVDYFSEEFRMLRYIWAVVKAETIPEVCWFSWIIISIWPLGYVGGFIVQAAITARGFDHQQVTPRRRRRTKTVNLERVRTQDKRPVVNNQYRHLYQVRRSNGDVISQNYIQGIQGRLSPALRGVAVSQRGAGGSSTGESSANITAPHVIHPIQLHNPC